MAWRTVLPWLGIALIATACASAGSASGSLADACTQKGGRWVAAAGTCEAGSGGGGVLQRRLHRAASATSAAPAGTCFGDRRGKARPGFRCLLETLEHRSGVRGTGVPERDAAIRLHALELRAGHVLMTGGPPAPGQILSGRIRERSASPADQREHGDAYEEPRAEALARATRRVQQMGPYRRSSPGGGGGGGPGGGGGIELLSDGIGTIAGGGAGTGADAPRYPEGTPGIWWPLAYMHC